MLFDTLNKNKFSKALLPIGGGFGNHVFGVIKSHFLQPLDPRIYKNQISETLLHINRTSLIIFQELIWLMNKMLTLWEPYLLPKMSFSANI